MNYWEQELKLNSLLAQRDDNFLHLARTPDQILVARSDFNEGKSGAFVPSMKPAAQLPVTNNLGPHYMPNTYSFPDKPGKLDSAVFGGLCFFFKLQIVKPFTQF